MVVCPADGTVFTSGNGDGHVLHWDPKDGRLLEAVGVKPSMVDALGISPDGRTLFVADPEGGPVLWDVAGRMELRRLTWDRMDGARNFLPRFLSDGRKIEPRYSRVVFSPDGRTAAADGHVWDLVAGRLLVALPGGPSAVAYSADGRRIMSLGEDGIRTWVLATGDEIGPPIRFEWNRAGNAAFSPDGRFVALGNFAPREPGTRHTGDRLIEPIRIRELASGQEVALLYGHTDTAFGLAFSPDARMLASVSGSAFGGVDPGVRIWDVATGKPLRRLLYPPEGGNSIAFLPDSRSIVTASNDGMALVWDVSDLADRRSPELANEKSLEALWSDLASDDAKRAHRASWSLSVEQAVPFLHDRLRPAAARDATTGPEVLRSRRAIAALERVGTAQARQILERIARGHVRASATQDAGEALLRLSRRNTGLTGGGTLR
jgi:WD40 repeat protein